MTVQYDEQKTLKFLEGKFKRIKAYFARRYIQYEKARNLAKIMKQEIKSEVKMEEDIRDKEEDRNQSEVEKRYEVIAAGQVADELPKGLAIKFLEAIKQSHEEVFGIETEKKENEMMNNG